MSLFYKPLRPRYILVTAGLCWGLSAAFGQIHIAPGATLTVGANATLTAQNADFSNNGSASFADGSVLRLQGTAAQNLKTNGVTLQTLIISKGSGTAQLQDNCTVAFKLDFTTIGGLLSLGNHDLVIASAATVTGYGNGAYVVTGGTGEMARQGLGTTSFTFPVGNDGTTYNPLTITENGTADEIGVRCLAAPLTNGTSGSALTADAVNASWEVSEASAGSSSLSLSAQWAASDELTGFVRSDCGIARYNTGTDWDLPPTDMGAATGSDPYLRTRSGLSPGVFMVADEGYMNRVLVSPKIMLQGPFNSTNDNMNDNLRSLAAFPTTAPSPYGTGKFVHSGWQPSAGYSIDASVLGVTGDDAIVDWVFLWFKDPTNTATNLQTRVALLQKDGDVVELDGVGPVEMPGNATQNYILGIGHRNHLSVRSPNGSGLPFNESTTTSYDFTTAQSQAYGTNPMKEVETTPTSIFALWGGNANENTSVRATGPTAINDYSAILTVLGSASTILSNVYSKADVNMDGTVRVTGPTNINDYSRLLNYLGAASNIISEQF